ncbi:MAG: TraB/GumN family protein [Gammaproteobacteria bacterium]
MKNSHSPRLLAKALLLFILPLQLAWSGSAIAERTAQYTQPEIRYIDRSKGERNRAIPVTPSVDRSIDTSGRHTDSPMLWRIEQADPQSNIRSSYIFGTIHMDNEAVMAIPDSVTQRLYAADTLMLELELNENSSIDVLRKMLFTDGKNLQQVLGETEYKKVSLALAKSGNQLPVEVLSVLKPWAAMLLLIKPENKSGTFLDKKLADIARSSNKRIEGLETIDEQLSVFDDLLLEDQVKMLRSTLSSLAEKDQAYKDLLDAYLSGDLQKIVQVSREQEPEDKALAQLLNTRLIDNRNQKMFDRIQYRLRQGNTFIAVGTLHLPGELGLLNKLRQAGYRLSRVGRNE